MKASRLGMQSGFLTKRPHKPDVDAGYRSLIAPKKLLTSAKVWIYPDTSHPYRASLLIAAGYAHQPFPASYLERRLC